MTPPGHDPRSPATVVIDAAENALYTGAWIAAGELPAAHRRLVRVGVVACRLAVASASADERPGRPRAAAAPPEPRDPAPGLAARRSSDIGQRLALVAAAGTVVTVGRHQLRTRWLASLARAGHAHPHFALARRLGAVVFVMNMAAPVVRSGRWASGTRQNGGGSGSGRGGAVPGGGADDAGGGGPWP